MTFKVLRTSSDAVVEASKTLLYAHAGWGKTTQMANYQRRFGKGLILSGEAGLISIADADIDFLPFGSWDGEHDPDRGVYSFRGICQMLATSEFREAGYRWIGIDSLTELSERLMEHLEAQQAAGAYRSKSGKDDAFAIWGDYGRLMLGALKWIRDMPLHVVVTALVKTEEDANGDQNHWPLVKGNALMKQLPGIFDNVFAGVRVTSGDKATPRVERYVVTDQVRGWLGKCRDPNRRLKPFERCDDVTELLTRIRMPQSEFEAWQRRQQDTPNGDNA